MSKANDDKKPTEEKFTDAYLRALDPEAAFFDVPDPCVPGLFFRVFDTGVKSWIYRYTSPLTKKRVKRTIGHYGVSEHNWTLAAARAKARDWAALVKRKIDPVQHEEEQAKAAEAVKAEEAKARAGRSTFNQVYEHYKTENLDTREKKKVMRTRKATQNMIENYILPVVGNVAVLDFDVDHYDAIIKPIMARKSGYQANRVHTYIQQLLKQARFKMKEKGMKYILTQGMPKPFDGEEERERALEPEEMIEVWHALPKLLYGDTAEQVCRFLKLLFASGQRMSEIRNLRRSWIKHDREGSYFLIPAAYMKIKRPHELPISTIINEIIEEQLPFSAGDIIFPSKMDKKRPMSRGWIGQQLHEIMPQFALGAPEDIEEWGFRCHDFRRTFSTLANRMELDGKWAGVMVERIMAHTTEKEKGSGGNYDRHRYFEQRLEVLEEWSDFLKQVVIAKNPGGYTPPNKRVPTLPANVVPIRSQRAA